MSLPTIAEYFNTVVAPAHPNLGSFSNDLARPGKVVCPFHGDVNPSMGIIPGTQVFHCFGCGVHGNVVKLHQLFLNRYEHKSLELEQAREDLCDLFGLPDSDRVAPTLLDRTDVLSNQEGRRDFAKHLPHFNGDVEYFKAAWSAALLRGMDV